MAVDKIQCGDLLTRLVHTGCERAGQEGGCEYDFYDVTKLGQPYHRLPVTKKILLECAVRKCHSTTDSDQVKVWKETANAILHDSTTSSQPILFHPGRVVLQDFTSVAALVDLASLRDEVASSGGDPSTVDSLCPADLVVDNFAQVDFSHIKTQIKEHKHKEGQHSQHPYSQPPPGLPPPPPPLPPPSPAGSLPYLETAFHQMSVGLPPPAIPTISTFPPAGASAFCPYFAAFPLPAASGPAAFSTPPPPAPLPPPPRLSDAESSPPNDNPGLPVQDSVCPFHQHMSFWAKALDKNRKSEFEKNAERFAFLKWVDSAFKNITVVPPGTGTMHQLNLEYLARVVTCQNDVLFPDSVVGTDNHTGMVNGLGVLGWKVGTLEAEAVMFGHPLTLPRLPKVVGVRLTGTLAPYSTSTDLVMLITKHLRNRDCNGATSLSQDQQPGTSGGAAASGDRFDDGADDEDTIFEFFGPGVRLLSVSDRSSVSNLCSEYGAVAAYFPIDDAVIKYLERIGRPRHQISVVQAYLDRVGMFRNEGDTGEGLSYDSVVTVDLGQVHVTVSGPKKAKDRVALSEIGRDFRKCLGEHYGVVGGPEESRQLTVDVDGKMFTVGHGSVLVASIASCTNTSNPTVMLAAGLLAKKAVEAGLSVAKFVRTSLAPGSGIVTSYLKESGVMPYLYMLGFEVVGYGCPKCVENASRNQGGSSGTLAEAVKGSGLVCVGVLSGNRNFEGRLAPEVKANYLTSAPMVVAFALAGRVDLDFSKEPLGIHADKPVYLSDIWPTPDEIQEVERTTVIPAIFNQLRQSLSFGNAEWAGLEVGGGDGQDTYQFTWNPQSTYIKPPRYVGDLIDADKLAGFTGLRCLAKLGHDVTSDHISPAGSIVRNSPAADYLASQGLAPRQFNSYGSRRGNWEVMSAGTFSHLKLRNLMSGKAGPYTVHHPSGVPTTIADAAAKYRQTPAVNGLVVVAGANFGRGAPRDWATKGPLALGVRVVLAVSFDHMYRSNLVKTGIMPLEISKESWSSITGDEVFSVNLEDSEEQPMTARQAVTVQVTSESTKAASVIGAVLCLYNDYEIGIFRNGGVIRDMFRRLNSSNTKGGS